MEITVKRLRLLIKETLAAQAPPDAPLGQYAWPKERHLPVNEPDTQQEEQLLKDIISSIMYTDKPLTKQSVDLLQDILANGWYNEAIRSPNVNQIYRGMTLNSEKLKTIIGQQPSHYGRISKEMNFITRNNGSCWSKNTDTSIKFASQIDPGQFSVIIVADTAKNNANLIDFKGFYHLNTNLKNKYNEEEVYAIGNTTISDIIWASYIAVTYLPNIFDDLLNHRKIIETKTFKLVSNDAVSEEETNLIQMFDAYSAIVNDELNNYDLKSITAKLEVLKLIDGFLNYEASNNKLEKAHIVTAVRFITNDRQLYSLLKAGDIELQSKELSSSLKI